MPLRRRRVIRDPRPAPTFPRFPVGSAEEEAAAKADIIRQRSSLDYANSVGKRIEERTQELTKQTTEFTKSLRKYNEARARVETLEEIGGAPGEIARAQFEREFGTFDPRYAEMAFGPLPPLARGPGVRVNIKSITVEGAPTDFSDIRRDVDQVMQWGLEQIYKRAMEYARVYDVPRHSLMGKMVHIGIHEFELDHPKQQGQGPFVADQLRMEKHTEKGVTTIAIAAGGVAKYIIRGTKPHEIRPAGFSPNGRPVYHLLYQFFEGAKNTSSGVGSRQLVAIRMGKRLHGFQHPGIKPQPFLRWAAIQYQGAIRAKLRSVIARNIGAKYRNVRVDVRLRGTGLGVGG